MQSEYEWFEAFGVELEYMIVDRASLDVRPIADELLKAAAGEITSEVERGEISWSNELALHVIELKSTAPEPQLARLPELFGRQIDDIGQLLQSHQAALLPTAMHPWMHPDRELRLWPHDYNPVYEAYNRIFDCRGHGWANLQSVHLNLPFRGDDQFGRLHAAIRILLPLLPALAASSPFVELHSTGWADNRLRVYRDNSRRVPSLTAAVVPEAVYSQADYQAEIFQPMYRDIAAFDPQGLLQYEWLNSRGAIARFDRGAIEIRVLDVQESPAADVALCEAIVAVLKQLVGQQWTTYAEQQTVSTQRLASVLEATSRDAEEAHIEDPELLRQLGISVSDLPGGQIRCGELWQRLIEPLQSQISQLACLHTIFERGSLARRLLRSAGASSPAARAFSKQALAPIYAELLLT